MIVNTDLNKTDIKNIYIFILTFFIFSIFAHTQAYANSGGGCHKSKQLGIEGYQKTAQLTHLTKKYLDDTDATVVLLGRKGSHAPDKRFKKRVGIWNYTHAGIAYKNPAKQTPNGQSSWTVIHLLNTCDDKSGLFKESLMQFSLSDLIEYKTVIAIPSPALQNSLYPKLKNKAFITALNNHAQYSSISNPFNTKFQNSNEYILDILVAGIASLRNVSIKSRKQSKTYFKNSDLSKKFVPEEVRVRFLERLGSSFGLGPGNASLRDHGLLERSDGKVDMVSVGALIQFLKNTRYLQKAHEVQLKNKQQAQDTQTINLP